jgi:hypothetical protein
VGHKTQMAESLLYITCLQTTPIIYFPNCYILQTNSHLLTKFLISEGVNNILGVNVHNRMDDIRRSCTLDNNLLLKKFESFYTRSYVSFDSARMLLSSRQLDSFYWD